MTSFVREHLAPEAHPLGEQPLDQILIAAAGIITVGLVLLVLGHRHRTGRTHLLHRWADRARSLGPYRGLPGWAALPQPVALASLLLVLVGMYWDIALHLDAAGEPFVDIAHYPVLFGLSGLSGAGVLAMILPTGAPPSASVRIRRGWYAPTGGILLTAVGFHVLAGFSLDGVWHRALGEEATFRDLTHLLLVGGTSLSLVAIALLEREGRLDGVETTPGARFVNRGAITGTLLVVLSVFQAEWDFGTVPLRMVHQPFMVTLAAGAALVVARLWAGRCGAVFAVGCYVVLRGGIALLVGTAVNELFVTVPLYFVEALCVEVLASGFRRSRPIALGGTAGLVIGAIGFAGEHLWAELVYQLPLTPDRVINGVLLALAGGVSGGVLGGLLMLALDGRLPRRRVSGTSFAGALLVLIFATADALLGTGMVSQARAAVTLTDVREAQRDRAALATVQLHSAETGPESPWLALTGARDGDVSVNRFRRVADGTYQTMEPVPLCGEWKTVVGLRDGRQQAVLPVRMPGPQLVGVPMPHDQLAWLSRREADRVPTWARVVSVVGVLVCAAVLLLLSAWGAQRLSREIARDRVAARTELPTRRDIPSK